MAETTQSCLGDPNFAVVCFYLQKFGPHLGLPELNLQQLGSSIEAKKLGSNFLRDLHLSLLRKLGRKSVSGGRWEKCVEQFAVSCCCVDGWYLSQHGYWELKLADKIAILKNLLEAQFDSNVKFKEKLNEFSAEDLRQQPLGYDVNGQAYWLLVDGEMNLGVFRGEQDDADGETWLVVSRERADLAQLIENLKKSAGGHGLDCSKPATGAIAAAVGVGGAGTPADGFAGTASAMAPSITSETCSVEAKAELQVVDEKQEPADLDGNMKNGSATCTTDSSPEPVKRKPASATSQASRATAMSAPRAAAQRATPAAAASATVKCEPDEQQCAAAVPPEAESVAGNASDAASDCSSDNVPLSQVRKSCRLLTRARAAIAEVKKRRDRDKLKKAKKLRKPKPPARSPRQQQNKKKPVKVRKGSESSEEARYKFDDDDEDDMIESGGSECSSDIDYTPHGRNAQRAARRKAAANSSSAAPGDCVINDDTPCTRCGEYTHPDLILLCDRCNAGFHTGCLRPPLFLIPDGDWFCPHCEHNMLIEKLEAALTDYDAKMKVKQRAVKRQERMAHSGISLDNIIMSYEERPKRDRVQKRTRNDDFEYELEDDVEERPTRHKAAAVSPLVKRSCRTRSKISYRYEEYDELIKSAIADSAGPQTEGEGVNDNRGADAADDGYCETRRSSGGRKSSGKDMASIMLANQASHCDTAMPSAPVSRGKDMSTILGADDDGESGSGSEEEESASSCSAASSAKRPRAAVTAPRKKKKSRKLTGLDDSASEDDEASDEYKATDDDEYDEEEDDYDDAEEAADSCDSDANSRGSSPGSWCASRRRRGGVRPERRATRSQPSRATKATGRRYAGLDDSGSDGDEEASGRRARSRRQAAPRRVRIAVSDEEEEETAADENATPVGGGRGRKRAAASDCSDRASDGSREAADQSSESEDGGTGSRIVNKWNKCPTARLQPGGPKKRPIRRPVVESDEEDVDASAADKEGTGQKELSGGDSEATSDEEKSSDSAGDTGQPSSVTGGDASNAPASCSDRTGGVTPAGQAAPGSDGPRSLSPPDGPLSSQSVQSGRGATPHQGSGSCQPRGSETGSPPSSTTAAAVCADRSAGPATNSSAPPAGVTSSGRLLTSGEEDSELGVSQAGSAPMRRSSADRQADAVAASVHAATRSDTEYVAQPVATAATQTIPSIASSAYSNGATETGCLPASSPPITVKRNTQSTSSTSTSKKARYDSPPVATAVQNQSLPPAATAGDTSLPARLPPREPGHRHGPGSSSVPRSDDHVTPSTGDVPTAALAKVKDVGFTAGAVRTAEDSKPRPRYGSPDVPDLGAGRAEQPAYAIDRRLLPPMQHQQQLAYSAAAAAARQSSQPAYYGPSSVYGGYPGPGQASGLPGYATASAGAAVPPYHMHQYYSGLPAQQLQQSAPPAYGANHGSYGSPAYARQHYVAAVAAMDKDGPEAMVCDPVSAGGRQSAGSHVGGPAAGARAMMPVDRSHNSHQASFMIDSILQSPQKATPTTGAVAEENEDELSNILDIVSYVTGAPVGDDRAHKS